MPWNSVMGKVLAIERLRRPGLKHLRNSVVKCQHLSRCKMDLGVKCLSFIYPHYEANGR